jgi:membrane protease YdiL (CAAX protease family)
MAPDRVSGVDDIGAASPRPADSPPAIEMPVPLTRWAAGLQAALVCGVPTQLFIAQALVFVTGLPVDETGAPPFAFFVLLSLIDTAVIAALVHTFLRMSGERSRDVFLGRRSLRGEVSRGLALVPLVFLAVTGIVLGVRAVAPWLHGVEQNPYERYLASPVHAGIFAIVVVLAGGFREELQRAFILHRFAQRLGGAHVGLVLFSILFGALHLRQGADVAIAIGLLGLFWGILYIRRRSVVVAMVNHSAFDAIQVVQGVIAKGLGG